MPPRFDSFFHLRADKAPLYRAILDAFDSARNRFLAFLRPADVLGAVRAAGFEVDTLDLELDQLVAWGNLVAHADSAEVATVEDFYRRRFLYQLTREGEATEEALGVFVEALGRHGELQAAALEDIRMYLLELIALSQADPLDGAKVYAVLGALQNRFDGLVEQAKAFLSGVQRAVDLHGTEEQGLLDYKDLLVGYLERFIGELARVGAEVAELLSALGDDSLERLASAAARREISDRLDAGPIAEATATANWLARLDGIATWFVSTSGTRSQADELRHRARLAIPALLGAILAHHERRLARSDRVADLRALARWFHQAHDDAEAHQIWRSCFTLTSTRHLAVDADTLRAWDEAGAGPHVSWRQAPPIEISPRLRNTGRAARQGAPPGIVDRSTARAWLAERREAEEALLAEAERQLLLGSDVQLSALPVLGERALDLLTDLVGEALSSGRPEVTSLDGRFSITLSGPTGAELAHVLTVRGALTGPDYTLRISRTAEAQ